MKNGKVRFCYEIGDAPCRACDIGDTIEYFLDEDISPTIDAIPVEWLREKMQKPLMSCSNPFVYVMDEWQKEQEAQDEQHPIKWLERLVTGKDAKLAVAAWRVLEAWKKEKEAR